MTQEHIADAEQLIRTGRSGSNRKLLQRKGAENGAMTSAAEALEDCFAAHKQVVDHPAPVPHGGSSNAPAATQGLVPAGPPLWSSEDEASLQTVLARRKAAGYQKRGKDVAGQVIRLGPIKPNEGTIAAVIIGIVAHAGTMNRGALVDAMAAANFPHPKARPTDREWCQGYVAGAIRSGFFAVAELSATLSGEQSATPSEISAKAEKA